MKIFLTKSFDSFFKNNIVEHYPPTKVDKIFWDHWLRNHDYDQKFIQTLNYKNKKMLTKKLWITEKKMDNFWYYLTDLFYSSDYKTKTFLCLKLSPTISKVYSKILSKKDFTIEDQKNIYKFIENLKNDKLSQSNQEAAQKTKSKHTGNGPKA